MIFLLDVRLRIGKCFPIQFQEDVKDLGQRRKIRVLKDLLRGIFMDETKSHCQT